MHTKTIIYDDYNSRIVRGGVIGTITGEAGNPAPRHSYKIIEIKAMIGTTYKGRFIPAYNTLYYLDSKDFFRGGCSVSRAVKSETIDLAVCVPAIDNKQIKADNMTLKQLFAQRRLTFRIRKLTPRECFRLMDLKESDIDKLQSEEGGAISNSQQYKLAGNSICVSPMKEIFRQMFRPDENHIPKTSDIQPEFDFGEDF